MTKDVKEALNTCGRNMALIAEENCLEFYILHVRKFYRRLLWV